MKWILIGHRGVGKSHLLHRLKTYLKASDLRFFDLDQVIEEKFQKSLTVLFPEVGEESFRQIEKECFRKIDQENSSYFLSVGAGFCLSEIPTSAHVLWVRRSSDLWGRIFLDRPRLNSQLSALVEFQERFSQRQSLYQNAATEVYWLPEGLTSPHPVEEQILCSQDLEAQGVLTVFPWHLKEAKPPCLRYGCDFYEIRDDLHLLEDKQWTSIPEKNRLLSFRDPQKIQSSLHFLSQMAQTDWALELGPCPTPKISIISCHQRDQSETLASFLKRLEAAANQTQHLKAAPLINNFVELQELMNWQAADPLRRSILPRSPENGDSGKWIWARLYQKGRQKLNFWRDSEGSSWDQPTLFEWLSTPSQTKHFAALMGSPVSHSRTMVEQSEYFSQHHWPVWPLLIEESEFQQALPFLITLGLRASAVTSPLKKQAALAVSRQTPQALELQSVNTLWISPSQGLHGHNTDLQGLEQLLLKAAEQLQTPLTELRAAVWGGGGTLSAIEKILPRATQLSVRNRGPRNRQQPMPKQVQLLIWAASPHETWPPDFDFEMIVDLNYREDSRARELALSHNKPYWSGDLMFEIQAQAQRKYWDHFFLTSHSEI